MPSWYVDTSALAKLVSEEEHSGEMSRFAAARSGDLIASDLVVTELLRAARRRGAREVRRAEEVLGAALILRLPRDAFRTAGVLDPPALRSLDALHVAAAREVGDLEALVTYDDRLAQAARMNGLRTVAPGR